jgi:hypothetical protein
MTLPPLPQSFTILSRLQSGTEEVVPLDMVRAYGKACAAAERDHIRLALCAMHADAEGRHNYYLCAAVELFGPPASLG